MKQASSSSSTLQPRPWLPPAGRQSSSPGSRFLARTSVGNSLDAKSLDIEVLWAYSLPVKRHRRESEATRAEDTSAAHLWLVLWKATRAVEAHAHKSIGSQPICPSDFAVLE